VVWLAPGGGGVVGTVMEAGVSLAPTRQVADETYICVRVPQDCQPVSVVRSGAASETAQTGDSETCPGRPGLVRCPLPEAHDEAVSIVTKYSLRMGLCG
jgi:hypothetical protein